MNNGKAFRCLDSMTCSYQCPDELQFLPGNGNPKGIGFRETFLLEKNPNSTRNGIKSTWFLPLKYGGIFSEKSFSWGNN